MVQKLLLISKDTDDAIFSETVASSCDFELVHFTNTREAVAFLDRDDPIFIFTELTANKDAELLKKHLGTRFDKNKVHVIVADGALTGTHSESALEIAGHLVINRNGDRIGAAKHYARICRALATNDPFGLDKLFGKDIGIQELTLTESIQKSFATSAISTALLEMKLQQRIANHVATAVDELIMNAMFDAPADELGKQLLVSTPRSTNLQLSKKPVKLRLASVGNYVAISILDLFGTLDRENIIEHFAKGFQGRQDVSFDPDCAGAGLGLAMVYRSFGSVFCACRRGHATEVTVIYETSERVRDFKRQFQFVSTWQN